MFCGISLGFITCVAVTTAFRCMYVVGLLRIGRWVGCLTRPETVVYVVLLVGLHLERFYAFSVLLVGLHLERFYAFSWHEGNIRNAECVVTRPKCVSTPQYV
jgi:hypothetical protein